MDSRIPLAALKRVAAVVDRVRPHPRGVVVLLYHRVGAGTGLQVDLPPDLFERQMATLAADRRAVSLDEALHIVASPRPPATSGADPVVVTFDDGTSDLVDTALPVLERFDVPATFYLATEFVDRGRSFPGGGTPLSWAAARDAVATGLITVGSHTHSHALLDRLAPSELAAELDRSRDLIADHLGVEARHFAYPKALAGSSAAEAAVRARFASAALAGTRPNLYGRTDPYRLARSPIQVADGMRYFRAKLAGGMVVEDAIRRLLNRGRYAGATT